jgi:hypothetical protein
LAEYNGTYAADLNPTTDLRVILKAILRDHLLSTSTCNTVRSTSSFPSMRYRLMAGRELLISVGPYFGTPSTMRKSMRSPSMAITSDTTLSRNTDVRYASVDTKEVALLNIAAGEIYAFNAVGSRIWELLEQPLTVAQLCAQICKEFEIDLQSCETAVLKFADEIVGDGIALTSQD